MIPGRMCVRVQRELYDEVAAHILSGSRPREHVDAPAVLLDDAFGDPQRHVGAAPRHQLFGVEGSDLRRHPRGDDLVAVGPRVQPLPLGHDHDRQPLKSTVIAMHSNVVPSACEENLTNHSFIQIQSTFGCQWGR